MRKTNKRNINEISLSDITKYLPDVDAPGYVSRALSGLFGDDKAAEQDEEIDFDPLTDSDQEEEALPSEQQIARQSQDLLPSARMTSSSTGIPVAVLLAHSAQNKEKFETLASAMLSDPRVRFAAKTYPRNPAKFIIYAWGTGYYPAKNYPDQIERISRKIASSAGDNSISIRFENIDRDLIDFLSSLDSDTRLVLTDRALGEDTSKQAFSGDNLQMIKRINKALKGNRPFPPEHLRPFMSGQPGSPRSSSRVSTEVIGNAIGKSLTGGDYDAAMVLRGVPLVGKYLINWRDLGEFLHSIAGKAITPRQFMNDPKMQDSAMKKLIEDKYMPIVDEIRAEYPENAAFFDDEKIIAIIHFRGEEAAKRFIQEMPDPGISTTSDIDDYLAQFESEVETSRINVTSGFGKRTDPITGAKDSMHSGLDISASFGTPVRASVDGKVMFSGMRGGYGNVVFIDHMDGFSTRYAHLESLDCSAGDMVSAGDIIGYVGSTGRSTGPHLHFELYRGRTAIDPTFLARNRPPV
jgi:murein DD-endopeptidase MepM/ murein hydrolase activator NlpD